MARNEIVPIGEIRRRAPEAGRIRLGMQVPNTAPNARSKTMPTAIKTFRFTSIHQDLIEQIAGQYGGTAEPWDEPSAKYRNQWQLISPVNQIRVYVPQDGLSQSYELWNKGGCERRCDGVTVETVDMHGNSAVPKASPCICDRKGIRECNPKTRIQVILPNIDFLGVWRLESGSWAALHELPGMFEMTAALQQSKLVDALLGIEARTDRVGGKTRHYVVPTLGIAATPLEIQAGMAAVAAIETGGHPSAGQRELGVERQTLQLVERNGTHHTEQATPDDDEDEVVEAELVSPVEIEWTPKLRELAAAFPDIDPVDFSDAVIGAAKGDAVKIAKVYDDVAEGRTEPIMRDGKIRWNKKQSDG